jgi:hypothetical protein
MQASAVGASTPDLRRQPLNYHYRHYWLLSFILGRNSNSIVRSSLRFAAVLSLILVAIFAVCRASNALYLDGDPVGLFEDWVMLGVCLWQFLGVPVLLWGIRKLDAILVELPHLVRAKDEAEREELRRDAIWMRDAVANREPKARRWYLAAMATILVLIGIFQFAIPLDPSTEARSWAIWPQRYPLPWVAAVFWALFYYPFVLTHFVWFIFAVMIVVFPRIVGYARQQRLVVSPVAPDERGGMLQYGFLVFAVLLLASGGLLIALPWYLIFPADWRVLAIIGFYGLILSLIYFFPLWHVHQAMRRARDASLSSLGVLFIAGYPTLMTALSKWENVGDAQQVIMETLVRLGSMEGVYRRIEEMPVWPTTKLVSWAASTITGSPIVISVFPVVKGLATHALWEWLLGPLRVLARLMGL